MSLTPLSSAVSTYTASTAVSQGTNPLNQLVAMLADGNQKVQAESDKSALAIQAIAKSMLALTSATQEIIDSQAAKIASLETVLAEVESQNKIVHAQKDAQIAANIEIVKAVNSKADLLQRQIDTDKKYRIVEKFNAFLEALKNDVRKHKTISILNKGFVLANTVLLAKTISLLNAINHGDPVYSVLETDIKAHQKTPVKLQSSITFYSVPSKVKVVNWRTINSDLFNRILLLQPYNWGCLIDGCLPKDINI